MDSVLTKLIENKVLDPLNNPEGYISFLSTLDKNLNLLNELSDTSNEPLELHAIEDPVLQATFRLQNLYFEEMQRVARPLTAMSAGVAGLKYSLKAEHTTLFGNPHILPFIPRFAYDSTNRPIALIQAKSTSSDKASPRQLTKKGLHIIQGLAQSRGA